MRLLKTWNRGAPPERTAYERRPLQAAALSARGGPLSRDRRCQPLPSSAEAGHAHGDITCQFCRARASADGWELGGR